MADIALNMGGDSKKILAEYDKLYRANVKLTEQNQKLANDSKKHSDEHTGHLQKQFHALEHFATGYLTVHKAVHVVKEAHTEWLAKMGELTNKQKEFNTELVRGLALSSQAANAPIIAAGLKSIPGISRMEAVRTYGGGDMGVAGGAPLEANPKRLLELTAAAAQVARLGSDIIDEGEFGKLVGMFHELAPDRSGKQLADLALVTRQKLGRNLPQWQSRRQFPNLRALVDMGVFGSAEEALATSIQASDQNPQLAAELKKALDRSYDMPKLQGRTKLTAEEQARVALARATTAQEKWQVISSNPAAAELAGVHGLDRFDQASRDRTLAELRGSEGAIGRTIAGAAQTQEGRQLQASREEKMDLGKSERQMGLIARGQEFERAKEILETVMAEEGRNWFAKAYRGWGLGIDAPAYELTGGKPVWSQLGTGGGMQAPITAALEKASPEAMDRFIRKTNEVEGYRKYDELGRLTEEGLKVQQEMRDELKRQGEERRSGKHGAAHVGDPNEP